MKKNRKEVKIKSEKVKKSEKVIKNTAQQTIPFVELYDNNMVLVSEEKGKKRYSITLSMSNTNYSDLQDTQKIKILEVYHNIINAISPDISYQELYINKNLNIKDTLNKLQPRYEVGNKKYEETYKNIQEKLLQDVSNEISETDMYITVAYTTATKLDNPYNILLKTIHSIIDRLSEIDVEARILNVPELLDIFYDMYNPFDMGGLLLPKDMYKRGTKIKDYIAPSVFNFKPKHIHIGSNLTRVFFVKSYSSFLEDSFIQNVLDTTHKVAISKHISHISKEKAIKDVLGRLKALESENQERNKRNKESGTTYIPYDLEREIESCKELLRQLEEKEELFDVAIYISVSARDKEELEDVSNYIKSKCIQKGVSLELVMFRQDKALDCMMPIATDTLNLSQYMLSSAVGMTIPFTFQKVLQENGFFYGYNNISKEPLIINRKLDKNGNGFVLAKSGAGKSFYCKLEINDIMFLTLEDRVIVLDPQGEFSNICKELRGAEVFVAPATGVYINPLDVAEGSRDTEDIIRNKSDLMLSIYRVIKDDKLTAKEKSIIDRCVSLVYKDFIESNYSKDKVPTFKEFSAVLEKQQDEEIRDILLGFEMYVTGSIDLFSHQTNVNMDNRFIVFNLSKLPTNLMAVGMLIVLETIDVQIKNNYKNNISTWLYADEFHRFYDNESVDDKYSSGSYFERIFSGVRKSGGLATGITQNVTGVVRNKNALSMLQNSQFVILLEQAKTNLEIISELYDLSDTQKGKLKSCPKGEGILINNNIPLRFNKLYPKDNIIYDTITTDFKDKQKKEKV